MKVRVYDEMIKAMVDVEDSELDSIINRNQASRDQSNPAESGRCLHNVSLKEQCLGCDKPENDSLDDCDHPECIDLPYGLCRRCKAWPCDCEDTRKRRGDAPPKTKNDAGSGHYKETTYPLTGTGWAHCSHKGEAPVMTINGCEIRALGASKWYWDPSGDVILDCTNSSPRPLILPAGFEDLRKYHRTDGRTIYVPWEDREAPPLQYVFWRELIKRLPAKGSLIVCCFAAHGRTGTALAALMLAADPNMTARAAIANVRKIHCFSAIESKSQERYLEDMARCKWRKNVKTTLTLGKPKAPPLPPAEKNTARCLAAECKKTVPSHAAYCDKHRKEGPALGKHDHLCNCNACCAERAEAYRKGEATINVSANQYPCTCGHYIHGGRDYKGGCVVGGCKCKVYDQALGSPC